MAIRTLLRSIGMAATVGLAAGGTTARTVQRPPIEGHNPFYVSNRAPLAPNPLIKLPIGSIRPGGWLRAQLKLMADGETGHLTEISPWCKFEGNAWVSPTGQGDNGWEEVPYWLKGFGDLGYVLKDERIKTEARKWIEGVLSSQREDGYFGPQSNKEKPDLWPNMPMLNVLQSFYEATGDPRILPFMSRYFRWELNQPKDILPGYWDKMRGGDNLESIFWLYNRTGETWLLDAAKKMHNDTADWTSGVINWHGVNICEGFREPAEYWQLSHDDVHLYATERNYNTVMGLYGQVPGGMFGADENARRGYGDPRQAAETCSMVEFMHSDQMLTGITGDPKYADRCEEIAFNSLPSAMTANLKGLHYLTAPNQPQLDREDKSPGIQNGGDMYSYNPEDYRCCQHNVAMGWPYYAEHLWMATRDRGIAAILYSEGSVSAKVGPGAGTNVTIRETTNYPFSDEVTFRVTASKPTRFPLYLRIPEWTKQATVHVNGTQVSKAIPLTYVVLERKWKSGDVVTLRLPMTLRVKTWKENANAVSVKRGPLWFALKIGEKSKKYGDKTWPGAEVFPTTPWNYGLVLNGADPAASFEVTDVKSTLSSQPFTARAAPISLTAKARRIPEWSMKNGLVDTLKPSPVKTEEPVETVTLIPMGCARLRMSAFPVVGDGPNAKPWPKTANRTKGTL